MVRAFAYGAMGRRIDPSWGGPIELFLVPASLCPKHLTVSTAKQNTAVSFLVYFSFHPVLHDWCNKGRRMCQPVRGMVHIKEPLLLIGKSSPCGGSGFPLSLSEWSFTICLTPYYRK